MSHALLSPSGSATWTTCTGSVARIVQLKAEGKIPEEDSTKFSNAGTEAHELAAACFAFGYCDEMFSDRIVALNVKSYVDYVESHVTGDGQLHVEEKVPLFYSPDDNGTVDAWVYHPGESGRGHLHIFDYKNGVIEVEAEGNTQLAIYAESLIQSHPELAGISMDAQVTMHIKQPNVLKGNPTKSWTLTRRELQDFCDPIQEVAWLIDKGLDPAIVPSKKACQFCDAKPFCAEHAAWKRGDVSPAIVEQAQVDPKQLPDTGTLSFEEQVAIALVYLDGGFHSWMKRVAESVQDQLNRGVATSDRLKLVRSKKHKTWTDVEEAAKFLARKLGHKAIYGDPKLITPNQAEKLLEAVDKSPRFVNKFNALVIRPEGDIVLTEASDPREAVKPLDAATEFGEVEEDSL